MPFEPPDLAAQRVERALREFEQSWVARSHDRRSVERSVDELETAVALWLEAASIDEPSV